MVVLRTLQPTESSMSGGGEKEGQPSLRFPPGSRQFGSGWRGEQR